MKHSKVLEVILVFVSFGANLTNGARIFGAFPTASISHQIVYRALMEELARRGHELVVMTTDPVHYKDPKYSNIIEIDVHDMSYGNLKELTSFENKKKESVVQTLGNFYDYALTIHEKQLSHPDIQRLLKKPKKFDLCFIETVLPTFTAFKDVFNCSMIQIISYAGIVINFNLVGNPTHPIYYFDVFCPDDYSDLTFWKRLQCLKLRIEYLYMWNWVHYPRFMELTAKFFGSNMRSLKEIEYDVDMVFLNYNQIFYGSRPLIPATITMGNIHIESSKPLPDNIQSVLDEAKNGVIYMSLGSNVKSAELPNERLNQFLEAFKDLPYQILWKWEEEELLNKTANIFVSKWFPQQSILAHHNVKLFITQGGLQSLDEGIHYGVPMIGIPFIFDQPFNVARIVKFGIGKRLYIDKLTSEDLKRDILNIIGNNSYHDNIVKLRDLIYDQPQTPMERAVWWTEYVIRHKGAKHLRSPVAGMSSLEYYLVYDIAVVLLFCVFVIFASVYLIKWVTRKIIIKMKLKKS